MAFNNMNTDQAGQYGYSAGAAPGSVQRQFLANPYTQQSLDLQKQGQNFGEDLARAKFGFAQNVFGQLMPMANSLLSTSQVGGQTSGMPTINRGPIYSQQQQQTAVNAQQANNNQSYQTLARQMAQSNAQRGFGGNSPALAAQQEQAALANVGQNAQVARELPMQYQQANADQTYRTDTLAQNQWQQGQQVDIARRQNQLQALQAILGSLGNVT
jgi:hypothetical protein